MLRVASIAREGDDGLCQCESGSGASLDVPFAGWTAVSSGGASCCLGGCESIAWVIAKSDRHRSANWRLGQAIDGMSVQRRRGCFAVRDGGGAPQIVLLRGRCVCGAFIPGFWVWMVPVHGGVGRSVGLRTNRASKFFERDKGIRWMPWHQEAMKDVARCEKPWGAASRR